MHSVSQEVWGEFIYILHPFLDGGRGRRFVDIDSSSSSISSTNSDLSSTGTVLLKALPLVKTYLIFKFIYGLLVYKNYQ